MLYSMYIDTVYIKIGSSLFYFGRDFKKSRVCTCDTYRTIQRVSLLHNAYAKVLLYNNTINLIHLTNYVIKIWSGDQTLIKMTASYPWKYFPSISRPLMVF